MAPTGVLIQDPFPSALTRYLDVQAVGNPFSGRLEQSLPLKVARDLQALQMP